MNEQFSDLAESIGEAAAQWQQSWGDWVQNLKDAPANSDSPAAEMAALSETAANMKMDPAKVMEIQAGLLKDFQALWMNTTARLMGQEAEPVITPARDDYRFKDADWDENPVFDFIKQSYLLNSRWIQQTLENIEGLDGEAVRKLNFVSRQLIDAMAPSNYAMTNPQVLREIADTKGESLVRGFKNLADDMKEGRDILRPTHTSMDNFEVGVDLATTPGSVVYQTPIMQLIQYAPTTEKVYKKPLLIVPPWINKFYILDLKPENSFIKWAVEKGYTVFVVSWANPDESFKDKSFDDYVEEGIFAALDGVEQATGERQVSAIGYCIGGTLLAAILARMAAENDDRITAATFFAAQVDFEDAGDLKVFTSEDGINKLEAEIGDKGYLDATSMAATFNMLRPNDLIWFFVINNYLMGKEPPVFDLLYWNGDATCFPAKLLLDYLRGMYQRNDLAEGRFTLLGKPANLGDIKIPTYIQAIIAHHIAP
ncbi:MAG: class I poly(R)-hydroxyalkanoic acid synthase, partial [Proteobacteria bacterium]|nr:class I poly(R)-hydroxyalkanoic acid synthase [Pseudomonadota bacterium]